MVLPDSLVTRGSKEVKCRDRLGSELRAANYSNAHLILPRLCGEIRPAVVDEPELKKRRIFRGEINDLLPHLDGQKKHVDVEENRE
jgi:hypothetical protein